MGTLKENIEELELQLKELKEHAYYVQCVSKFPILFEHNYNKLINDISKIIGNDIKKIHEVEQAPLYNTSDCILRLDLVEAVKICKNKRCALYIPTGRMSKIPEYGSNLVLYEYILLEEGAEV